MHLVLIETSGNQRYIFATNKLRENVGASELTYRIGTQWVLQSDDRMKHLWPHQPDATHLRKNLLNQDPISSENPIEVIAATSGKALLLVNQRDDGKAIIENVSRRALKEAPGIDVCGVIGDRFDLTQKALGEAVREVHEKLERIRNHRPGAALRFLRLPVVMECATSGLPAATWERLPTGGELPAAHSVVTQIKRTGSQSYGERMRKLLQLNLVDEEFASNVGVLEKYCDWLAVVHADGNGVGQIFLDFWKNSGCDERYQKEKIFESVNRSFIDLYRRFSIALDVCTEEAFISALHSLRDSKDELRSLRRIEESHDDVLPILPIVLGGDDLTIVCDGQAALQFMRDFLIEFEKQTHTLRTRDRDLQTKLNGVIPRIAERAFNVSRLSACAGIAIVKPHFPFSAAYELTEQLINSAKIVKQKIRGERDRPYPCSALDFHVLYDTSGSDLYRIREKLKRDDGATMLDARPYVVTPRNLLSMAPKEMEWASLHGWEELQKRVNAVLARDDDGRRCLPNSQLHDLRGGLFLGKEGANARYRLIRQRYLDRGITAFDENNGEPDSSQRESLFFEENIEDAGGKLKRVDRTRLLDALDAVNFWVEKNQQNSNRKEEAQ